MKFSSMREPQVVRSPGAVDVLVGDGMPVSGRLRRAARARRRRRARARRSSSTVMKALSSRSACRCARGQARVSSTEETFFAASGRRARPGGSARYSMTLGTRYSPLRRPGRRTDNARAGLASVTESTRSAAEPSRHGPSARRRGVDPAHLRRSGRDPVQPLETRRISRLEAMRASRAIRDWSSDSDIFSDWGVRLGVRYSRSVLSVS
jgi:hypothetical protein